LAAPSSLLFGSGVSQELSDDRVMTSLNPELATASAVRLNPRRQDFGQTWFIPPEKCDKKQYLQINLGQEMQVSTVITQGGEVLAPAPKPLAPVKAPESAVPQPVTLSGKGVADVNQESDQTEIMMGEMISWEALLKTTPPKKLLKRPPVRFLFDLFNKVSEETGYISEIVSSVKWEELGGKKDKLQFMDRVIVKVTVDLALPDAPAKGSDIVTGNEAGNTNRFLQFLALAAAKHKSPSTGGEEETKEEERPSTATPLQGLQPIVKEPRGSWITKYKVLVSMDGQSWAAADGSPFKANKDSKTPVKRELASPARCQYIRFQPTRWEYCICLRVDIVGWTMEAIHHYEAAKAAVAASLKKQESEGEEAKASTEAKGPSLVDQLLQLLSGMNQGVEAVLAGAQAHEKLEKLKIQLKKEKMQSLTNEKDKLEAQLEQANEERDTLQAQNTKLNDKLLSFEAEKLELKNLILQLQAESEKLKAQNEDLNKSLEDVQNNKGKNDEILEKLQEQNSQLVEEKEEKNLQIEVLTEERDNARVNEEELFQALSEKSEDLEQLQQSYVYMTDRCNNYQDTIAELEEKLEGYQNLISSGTILKDTPSQSSLIHSNGKMHEEQQTVNQGDVQSSDIGKPPILVNSDGGNHSSNQTEETDNSDYDDDFEDNEEEETLADPPSTNNIGDGRVAVGSPATGRSKSRRPESAHRSGRHASFNNNMGI